MTMAHPRRTAAAPQLQPARNELSFVDASGYDAPSAARRQTRWEVGADSRSIVYAVPYVRADWGGSSVV